MNLEHYGGEANTGLVFALVQMLARVDFERGPRRTTLSFERNGRTIVMRRCHEDGQVVVSFHVYGDDRPIVRVRPADVRARAQRGDRRQRMRAVEAALFDVAEALFLATERAA